MGAIQLYSADNARYSVNVSARTHDGTQSVEAIVISALNNAGVAFGPVEFKVAFELPAEFVKRTESSRPGPRSRATSRRSGMPATQRWSPHGKQPEISCATPSPIARSMLRPMPAAFLGIDGVGFAGAQAAARLAIDLVLLDPTLTPKPADDSPIAKKSSVDPTLAHRVSQSSADGVFGRDTIRSR
jgi:hypothetical protein